MATVKHTPGPWEVGSDGYVNNAADAFPVARVERKRTGSDANAKLIAAAPEVTDALEDAAKRCAEIDGGSYPGHECAICESWLVALRKAGRLE